jgi:hypothetical protein
MKPDLMTDAFLLASARGSRNKCHSGHLIEYLGILPDALPGGRQNTAFTLLKP